MMGASLLIQMQNIAIPKRCFLPVRLSQSLETAMEILIRIHEK